MFSSVERFFLFLVVLNISTYIVGFCTSSDPPEKLEEGDEQTCNSAHNQHVEDTPYTVHL